VSCTAADAAGNTQTVTFTITVTVSLPIVRVSGNTVVTNLGGFRASTKTLVTVFSEPRVLGEVVTDANGEADYLVEVPTDLPPGPHTITVIGIAPDGSDRLWAVPIVIAADGSLSEVRVGDGNAVVAPTPPALPEAPVAPSAPAQERATPGDAFRPAAGPLPETGSSPATIVWLALASALLGTLLWGGSRGRRGATRR
jgi:LPXTG-motif cell wall-anchored protein